MFCLTQTLSNLSPISQTLLFGVLTLIIYQLWSYWRNFRQFSKQIDHIPGPKVGNFLLGHLSLIWQRGNNTDWFQRKLYDLFVTF